MKENKKSAWLIALAVLLFICFTVLTISVTLEVLSGQSDMINGNSSVSDFEIKAFNNQFEAVDGSQYSLKTGTMLERVADHNKNNPKEPITLYFEQDIVQTPEEILAFKNVLDKNTEYFIELGYSDDGLVNSVYIEKINDL